MVYSRAGVWIDQTRAVIVRLDDDECTLYEERSGIRFRVRVIDGTRSRRRDGSQNIPDERREYERREQQLRRFCQQIAAGLTHVEEVLILGPGTTKHGLCKALARGGINVVSTRTAGPLNHHQLETEVRTFFESRDTERQRVAGL